MPNSVTNRPKYDSLKTLIVDPHIIAFTDFNFSYLCTLFKHERNTFRIVIDSNKMSCKCTGKCSYNEYASLSIQFLGKILS